MESKYPTNNSKNRTKSLRMRPLAAGGFSLFELVVFIISVAIIYSYAANRFASFPGQAERANFIAITTQIQSAINIEMVYAVGTGRLRDAALLEGVNPMDLLLEPPSNYLGAFEAVDSSRFDRRSWYFDRSSEELVYLANDSSGLVLMIDGQEYPTREVRFRIVAEFAEYDRASGLPASVIEGRGRELDAIDKERKLKGVIMRPVVPYRWYQGDAVQEYISTDAI